MVLYRPIGIFSIYIVVFGLFIKYMNYKYTENATIQDFIQ